MPPLQFRSAAGPRPGLFGGAGAHAGWLAVVVAVVGVAWMLVAETQKRLRLEAESVQVLSVLCSQAVVQDEFLKQVTQQAVSIHHLEGAPPSRPPPKKAAAGPVRLVPAAGCRPPGAAMKPSGA